MHEWMGVWENSGPGSRVPGERSALPPNEMGGEEKEEGLGQGLPLLWTLCEEPGLKCHLKEGPSYPAVPGCAVPTICASSP